MKYKNRISYSQYVMWNTCPFRWKLTYIDKIKFEEPSIHLIFGSAIHETIQSYVVALYSKGVKYADRLELENTLKEKMGIEYKFTKNKYKNDVLTNLYNVEKEKDNKNDEKLNVLEKMLNEEEVKFTDNEIVIIDKIDENINNIFDKLISKDDMVEFYHDGIKIINAIKKQRTEFFNLIEEELIDIEFKLEYDLRENLNFIAYLDILLKNKKTHRLKIIDLKSSTKGWNSNKKKDVNTTDQLVLYKKFYFDKYNVDIKDIDVEFIILKRKLYQDIPYKQKRTIRFVPSSGKPTINKTMDRFNAFLNYCFDEKGNYKKDIVYPKIPVFSACRFCPFNDKPSICNKKN